MAYILGGAYTYQTLHRIRQVALSWVFSGASQDASCRHRSTRCRHALPSSPVQAEFLLGPAGLLPPARRHVDFLAQPLDGLSTRIGGPLPCTRSSRGQGLRLFSYIEAMSVEAGCTLTLFADDITISGPHASKALLSRVKRRILGRGLRANPNEDKSAPTGSAVVITGAVRQGDGLRLRNEHRKSIVEMLVQYEAGDFTLEDRLASKIAAAKSATGREQRP